MANLPPIKGNRPAISVSTVASSPTIRDTRAWGTASGIQILTNCVHVRRFVSFKIRTSRLIPPDRTA